MKSLKILGIVSWLALIVVVAISLKMGFACVKAIGLTRIDADMFGILFAVLFAMIMSRLLRGLCDAIGVKEWFNRKMVEEARLFNLEQASKLERQGPNPASLQRKPSRRR